MNKNLFLPVSILSAILVISGCRNTPPASNNSDTSITIKGDSVSLGRNYPSKDKIITETAGSQKYTSSFTTTGVIRPMTGQLAEISVPFEGRITSSFVSLGQKISRGAPVFGLASQDYFEAVKNLQQSAKEKETAQRNFDRKKELLEQGVASRKDFDEASLQLETARKEYDKSSANLKIFNVDPSKADFNSPLIISSPISGEVVSINLTIGQYLHSDSDPVVVVANLDKVWVVAHIKEKDLGRISIKDQVDIVTESLPDRAFSGSVEYIGNIMEDQTRSVEVFIECANPDKLIKPGMFVTVHFKRVIDKAILIPATAILQDEDRTYLFLKVSDNLYVKRTVSAVSAEDHKMLIISGVTNGETIVSEGGIYLR